MKEKEVIKCAECAFFLKEEWGVVDKLPAIINRNMCEQWNQKVDATGYCYKAKKFK